MLNSKRTEHKSVQISKSEEIADAYGYDAQSRQLIEEMAELTQAINKFWRKNLMCGFIQLEDVFVEENEAENLSKLSDEQEYKNIVEEIADVEICLEQIKYLLKIDNNNLNEIKDYKYKRQLERMREDDDFAN